MNLLDKLKDVVSVANDYVEQVKAKKIEGKTFHEAEFFAVGVSYYEKDLEKLLTKNKEYRSFPATIIKNGHAGQKIYQYDYLEAPAKLIPEPKNKHDKNAVKICISGKLVGYKKQEETYRVKRILSSPQIDYINAFVAGGKYKVVFENKDTFENSTNYNIRINIGYYE